MNSFQSIGRVTTSLAHAQEHWRQRRQAHAEAAMTTPALTIALSREMGCPGTTVAHEVGQRLGWPVYDHELVEKIAQEMGLRVNLLETIDERQQSWIEECVESFALEPTAGESAYVRHLTETILSLGLHGDCVIVGRGAAHILPQDTTLRLRLVAPMEHRVAVIRERLGLSETAARRHINKVDRERTAFTKDHFQKDPRDCRLYDLVLNTARWSVSECADLILDAFRQLRDRSVNS